MSQVGECGSGLTLSVDPETVTFSLPEAAEDARQMAVWHRVIFWGFCGFFWTGAALLVVLPAPSPLWLRILVGIVLAILPLISFRLARVLRPELMAPRRMPLEMAVSGSTVEVRFTDRPRVSYRLDDPSLRVVVFEAKHPSREPLRWLYFNNDSFYQGIRLGPAVYDALSRALVQHNFSKRVHARVARYPTRQLTWTTYLHDS
jgi:hypothetical protein